MLKTQKVALFVEKSLQQWIVRDPEGNLWIEPKGGSPLSGRGTVSLLMPAYLH
jgi:hypothetical protein